MGQYISYRLNNVSVPYSVGEPAPVTGDPVIDAALAGVVSASGLDPVEQAKQLGDAQFVLTEALRASRPEPNAGREAARADLAAQ